MNEFTVRRRVPPEPVAYIAVKAITIKDWSYMITSLAIIVVLWFLGGFFLGILKGWRWVIRGGGF
uniref:Uncharacterized protein n=1 Tax=Populus trichocarpa TaxID=3694 RepID=A0A2K2BT23_POPTR